MTEHEFDEHMSLIEIWKKRSRSRGYSHSSRLLPSIIQDLQNLINEMKRLHPLDDEPCCAWNINNETEYCAYHQLLIRLIGEEEALLS